MTCGPLLYELPLVAAGTRTSGTYPAAASKTVRPPAEALRRELAEELGLAVGVSGATRGEC